VPLLAPSLRRGKSRGTSSPYARARARVWRHAAARIIHKFLIPSSDEATEIELANKCFTRRRDYGIGVIGIAQIRDWPGRERGLIPPTLAEVQLALGVHEREQMLSQRGRTMINGDRQATSISWLTSAPRPNRSSILEIPTCTYRKVNRDIVESGSRAASNKLMRDSRDFIIISHVARASWQLLRISSSSTSAEQISSFLSSSRNPIVNVVTDIKLPLYNQMYYTPATITSAAIT